MWGPDEFNITGTLAGWDRSSRLGEITVPTLVLAGRYDEAPPELAQELHEGIQGSELVIFEGSSHVPHLEEPDRYFEVVRDFVRRTEVPA
jgi:proline iminopeptidase